MRKKVRRRNYLVKKGLQLRYVGVIFFTTLFITLVMMFYMAWNVDQITELTTTGGFSIEQGLAIWKNTFLLKLGLVLLGLLALNVVVSILASHKVAGVVFRLEKIINSVSEGKIPSEIRTRRGDELGDLVERFNVMLANLNNRVANNRTIAQKLTETIETLDNKLQQDPVSKEELRVHLNMLKQLRNELQT